VRGASAVLYYKVLDKKVCSKHIEALRETEIIHRSLLDHKDLNVMRSNTSVPWWRSFRFGNHDEFAFQLVVGFSRLQGKANGNKSIRRGYPKQEKPTPAGTHAFRSEGKQPAHLFIFSLDQLALDGRIRTR
jgi:hypothetical protein